MARCFFAKLTEMCFGNTNREIQIVYILAVTFRSSFEATVVEFTRARRRRCDVLVRLIAILGIYSECGKFLITTQMSFVSFVRENLEIGMRGEFRTCSGALKRQRSAMRESPGA